MFEKEQMDGDLKKIESCAIVTCALPLNRHCCFSRETNSNNCLFLQILTPTSVYNKDLSHVMRKSVFAKTKVQINCADIR